MRHPAPSKNECRSLTLNLGTAAHAPTPRHRPPVLASRSAWAGLLLAAVLAAGCASVELDQPIEPPLTSVDTWQLAMKRQGNNQVLIAYTPPLSAQRQYTGANHQSDGQVLVVSLRSCLVSEECPTLLPAQPRTASDRARWYEVVVPYQGERVVVEGDGPGKQELVFAP